jgi:hypothetical protein
LLAMYPLHREKFLFVNYLDNCKHTFSFLLCLVATPQQIKMIPRTSTEELRKSHTHGTVNLQFACMHLEAECAQTFYLKSTSSKNSRIFIEADSIVAG